MGNTGRSLARTMQEDSIGTGKGDQYDALRCRRPNKPAFSHETTQVIITVGDGRTLPSHFDPAVLAAFKGCVGRFRDVFEAHRDES